MTQNSESIPGILEIHFEELQSLWRRRRSAIYDPDYLMSDLKDLDERIAAHIDGLVIGGANAIPILEKGLAGDESSTVFAAAYLLLVMQNKSITERVVAVFETAEGDALDGFLDAFCHVPIVLTEQGLKSLAASAPAAVASIATNALAFHGLLDTSPERLRDFFDDEDPHVRRTAWRIVSLHDQSAPRMRV